MKDNSLYINDCSMHQPIDTMCMVEEILECIPISNREDIPLNIIKILIIGIIKRLRINYEYYEGDIEECIYEYFNFRCGLHNAEDFFVDLE